MTTHVTLVTGGAQGIGKAITKQFLAQGHHVVIADWDAEAGEETRAEFAALGGIDFVHADVSHEPEVMVLARRIEEQFGRLDNLINNAAVTCTKPLTELTLEDWSWVLSVNLSAPWLLAKHLSPLLARTSGSIINITSTRAHMSEANTEAYSASKGGLLALTHALAISLGPQVRVNSISPGWIEVSEWKKQRNRHPARLSQQDHLQHPAGRVGKPEDVAAMAAYLCSDQARFITGQDFVVDGGMSKKMIYCE